MSENNKLNIAIDYQLQEKFNLALMLNNETEDEAIRNMIKKYIADSFLEESKKILTNDKVKSIAHQQRMELNDSFDYLDVNSSKYGKAKRKIPIWARRKHQNNHKIIKAFFEIEKESGSVRLSTLKSRCTNLEKYPSTFCSDFDGNFASMKSDAGNSHGKIFVVEDSQVKVWEVVINVLEEHKHYFINSK